MDSKDRIPSLVFSPSLSPVTFRAALIWALDLAPCERRAGPSPWPSELLARVRAAGETFIPAERKAAVRAMLRHGVYKPAGRAKPASEYLLAAALEGDGPTGAFPFVNGPVNANNAVSLAWGYPASVFDLARTGRELLVRRGLPGESYVFNPSGQTIDLEDLLLVCRRAPSADGWEPCGNPVKDSMATKVFDGCTEVAAVVFAPAGDPRAELEACAARFESLLREDSGAETAGHCIIE
jgi:DNA/RNA-binding domain of Phe-tRNA-synthetase-like protein